MTTTASTAPAVTRYLDKHPHLELLYGARYSPHDTPVEMGLLPTGSVWPGPQERTSSCRTGVLIVEMEARCPTWRPYPWRCGNGHEWGSGLVLVSWEQCHCAGAQRLHPDRVICPALRADLERQETGHVLAVACRHRFTSGLHTSRARRARQPPAPVSMAAVLRRPGRQGHRYYDWAWVSTDPSQPGHHWLLIRRNQRTRELAFYGPGRPRRCHRP